MRQAFESEAQKTGKERLLISMAVPASLEYAGQGYAIDRLDEALDFFNLLTYDYHSAHEPAVNHHSPLYRFVTAADRNWLPTNSILPDRTSGPITTSERISTSTLL